MNTRSSETSNSMQSEPYTPPPEKTKTDIEIVLTFDDGPHAETNSNKNKTRRILDFLKTNNIQNGIKAAFFVETHSNYRAGSATGAALIRRQVADGHVVGIHSKEGHVSHVYLQENNKLSGELQDSKQKLNELVPGGYVAKYVRAVGGAWTPEVEAIYTARNLLHIFWDVESGDSLNVKRIEEVEVEGGGVEQKEKWGLAKPDDVDAALVSGVTDAMNLGKRALIVLFHDINRHTGKIVNLERYLRTIEGTINKFEDSCYNAVWVTDTNRLKAILDSKATN